jgi:transposase-like protein
MTQKRRQYTASFKFKVALEAAREQKTVNQLASEYGLHPNQVGLWKKQLLTEGAAVFQNGNGRAERVQATKEAELYEQIGRLKMELAWVEKKAASQR